MKTCAVVAALAAIASCAPVADQSCPNSKLPFEDRMALLTSTNNLRDHAQSGEPLRLVNNRVLPPAMRALLPMEWDCDLEKSAQEVADSCTFRHSNNPDVGENIWMATSDLPLGVAGSGIKAFDSWLSSIAALDSQDMILREKDAAAFPATQMLWEATTRMGCGVAMCSDNRVSLVCHYEEKGNKFGDSIYELDPNFGQLDMSQMRAAVSEPIQTVGGAVVFPEDGAFVDAQATADEFVPAHAATEEPTTTLPLPEEDEFGVDPEPENFEDINDNGDNAPVMNGLQGPFVEGTDVNGELENENAPIDEQPRSFDPVDPVEPFNPDGEVPVIEDKKETEIFDNDGNLIGTETVDQGVIIDNFSSDKNSENVPEAMEGVGVPLEPMDGGDEFGGEQELATVEPVAPIVSATEEAVVGEPTVAAETI